MKTNKLLPRWTRILGLAMITPCLLAFIRDPEIVFGEGVFSIFGEPSGRFTFNVLAVFDQTSTQDSGKFAFYSIIKNDLLNEILLTLMLVGTYLIAFAKVKEEDEFSNQLRKDAMNQALVYNGILFLIFSWIFFEGMYLYTLIIQPFSFLLIFSFVFALKIRNYRKMLGNEE